MIGSKRMLIMALLLALAVGAWGGAVVSAQNDSTAWLGVTVLDTDGGVTIHTVMPDSPADQAGLKRGDIIQAVDGTKLESAQALVETVQSHAPGDEIVLSVSSGGAVSDVSVTLAERPAIFESTVPRTDMGPHTGMFFFLGLDTSVTDEGMVINAIGDNSPLADSGLQVGDVITKINGESVLERGMMRGFQSDEPLVFTVLRDGEEMEIKTDVTLSNMPQNFNVVPGEPGSNYAFGEARPTQLGVQFENLTPDMAKEKDLTVEQGALVVQVYENTPAAEAGLQADDIITAVSGELVDEEHTLADRLYAYEEGDVVTLGVLRDGKDMQIDVTLGPRAPQPMFFNGYMGPQGMPYDGPQFFGQDHMMPFGHRMFGQHMPGFFGGHMFRGPRQGGRFWFHANPDEKPAPAEPESAPAEPGA